MTTSARLAAARDTVIRAASAYFDALQDDKATKARRRRAHGELELAVRDHDTVELEHLATLNLRLPDEGKTRAAPQGMSDKDLEQARAWAETVEEYPVKCGYLTLLDEIERLRGIGQVS